MHNYNSYLIRLLQEEAESARAEVSLIRNSIRYRIGGLAVQAFPPSLGSFRVLWLLIRLLLARRKGSKSVTSGSHANVTVNTQAHLWIFSSAKDIGTENSDAWITNNAALLAQCADKSAEPKTLLLRDLSAVVVRRIARLKLQGWNIIWHPQSDAKYDAAMTAYVIANANECRSGETA